MKRMGNTYLHSTYLQQQITHTFREPARALHHHHHHDYVIN